MSEPLNNPKWLVQIYLLFCKIGLHQDVYGEGYVELDASTSFQHNGYRCIWCGRCKGADRG